jgi:radical SAM protein with 4Fe4S-binding SPASM domain
MSLSRAFFLKNHFVSPSSVDEKRKLFKESVSNIVVEISSYCNRQCNYCPVSQVDRSSINKILPDSIFQRIVDDLALIDYSGGICLNLYNEPTANRDLLLARIITVRKQLSKSRIYFSTNGDFLNRDYINEMVDAGLSELYVTLHTPKGKPYLDTYVIDRFCELSVRLSKAIKVTTFSSNQTVQGDMTLFGIRINIFSTNYDILGTDRAGAIKSLTEVAPHRVAPCDRPFKDFTVSYDGTIFPCCQMFADNESHKERFAIGNISSYETIFDAYASNAMVGWRSSLLRFGPKSSPCDTCSEANLTGSKEERQARELIYRQYVSNVSKVNTPNKAKILFRLFQVLGK